jgi:flagellin
MAIPGIGSSGAHQISSVTRAQQVNLGQISSGRRITHAGIDPAGAAIVVELDTQAASQRQAIRNSNDGMSMLQIADGVAGSATDQLQRIRELAVQAASGTLSDDGRAQLQLEVDELVGQIDSQAESTEFNGVPLTDGSLSSVDVQTGTGSGDQTAVPMVDMRAGTLGVAGLSISSVDDARAAIDAVDAALGQVSDGRSTLGASHNRMTSAINTGEQSVIATESAASEIGDTDFIQAIVEQASLGLRKSASLSAQVQAHNISRTSVLGLL